MCLVGFAIAPLRIVQRLRILHHDIKAPRALEQILVERHLQLRGADAAIGNGLASEIITGEIVSIAGCSDATGSGACALPPSPPGACRKVACFTDCVQERLSTTARSSAPPAKGVPYQL